MKKKITLMLVLVMVFSFSIVGYAIESPEMVTVPSGTAADGSTSIGYDIEVGKYEVTHAEFIEFLNDAGVASDGSYKGKEVIDMDDSNCAVGHDGSSFSFAVSDYAESENTPVIEVTWYGALAYCNWLSEQDGLTPAYDLNNWELKASDQSTEGYRLPTETEWEYATRGGANGVATTYAGAADTDDSEADDPEDPTTLELADVAWYENNSGGKLHPIGEKQANELGIYDMSGNVREWTNDTLYSSDRINRGGNWLHYAYGCEVDGRAYITPSISRIHLWFRLTKTQ